MTIMLRHIPAILTKMEELNNNVERLIKLLENENH